MNVPQPPEAVPPAAAARMLCVCRATLNRMIRDGRLRSFKLGRARRIPVEALRELIERAR
jgi:excisionase family DNA binding protein